MVLMGKFILDSILYLLFILILLTIIAIYGIKDIRWIIPPLVILTFLPLPEDQYINPINVIYLVIIISYFYNPSQIQFSRLKNYKTLLYLIFSFIFIDFISTVRMTRYWLDESVIHIFLQYFIKSNFYPLLFILIIIMNKKPNFRIYLISIILSIITTSLFFIYKIIFSDLIFSPWSFNIICQDTYIHGDKNIWGNLNVFSFVICFWFFNNERYYNKKVFFFIMLVLSSILVFITFSRQAILLYSIVLSYSIYNYKADYLKKILFTAFSIALISIFILIARNQVYDVILNTFGLEKDNLVFEDINLDVDKSSTIRKKMYTMQWKYFSDFPHYLLIGGGKAHSRVYLKKYRGIEGLHSVAGSKAMHSVILAILDNYGLIRFIIYSMIHLLIIKKSKMQSQTHELILILTFAYIFSYFFHGHHLFTYHFYSILYWVVGGAILRDIDIPRKTALGI